MVRYLLDTNTFSYIATVVSPAARAEFRRLLDDPNAELGISSITEAEIRFGMEKRALGPARKRALETLMATLEILPWDSRAAVVYGIARASLEEQGLSMAAMDLLIGAHAASLDAVLVTRDNVFTQAGKALNLRATVNWATDL